MNTKTQAAQQLQTPVAKTNKRTPSFANALKAGIKLFDDTQAGIVSGHDMIGANEQSRLTGMVKAYGKLRNPVEYATAADFFEGICPRPTDKSFKDQTDDERKLVLAWNSKRAFVCKPLVLITNKIMPLTNCHNVKEFITDSKAEVMKKDLYPTRDGSKRTGANNSNAGKPLDMSDAVKVLAGENTDKELLLRVVTTMGPKMTTEVIKLFRDAGLIAGRMGSLTLTKDFAQKVA